MMYVHPILLIKNYLEYLSDGFKHKTVLQRFRVSTKNTHLWTVRCPVFQVITIIFSIAVLRKQKETKETAIGCNNELYKNYFANTNLSILVRMSALRSAWSGTKMILEVITHVFVPMTVQTKTALTCLLGNILLFSNPTTLVMLYCVHIASANHITNP